MKKKTLEDYSIELNTMNFISLFRLSGKVEKMLEKGNLDLAHIEALQRMNAIFDPRESVNVHDVKMQFDKEYKMYHDALKEAESEQDTVGCFVSHLIDKPGNNIETFKKDDLGKEELTEGETFLLNEALENFNKEMSKNTKPRIKNKREIFQALEECNETAKRGAIPNCEETKLFFIFGDLYYETWEKSEELKLDHETVFISNINLD